MPAPAVIAPHRPQPVPTSFDRLTVDEYLALDASSERKWEYHEGSVRAMAGASFEHTLVAGNVTSLATVGLRQTPCTVHPSDLRVAVSEAVYYYPDVVVVCGPPDLTDSRPRAVRNPALVVEVLSDSTGQKDRTEKRDAYQQIASLHTYAIFWQDEARAEVWRRAARGQWMLEHARGLDAVLTLEAIGLELPLAEVYRNVVFGPE